MNIAARISTMTFFLFLGSIATGSPGDGSKLVVRPDTPVVNIDTRAAGRIFMRLPSLHYSFEIENRCRADLSPRSISLSVADTRKSVSMDKLSSTSSVSVDITIPAGQIGPIAVDGFCLHSDERSEGQTDKRGLLGIPSVLSVQVALLCASETESQMTYASTSLGVTLMCNQLTDDETPATDNQGTSD